MRVALAVQGSAGDLFPLLPIADALAAAGQEVTLLVPRDLGFYLRLMERQHLVYGRATQTADVRDAHLVTDRFGGWSSWRRLFEKYVGPALRDDVASAGAAIDGWEPDVVATATVATAPRIASLSRGIPHVSISVFPQFYRLAEKGSPHFAARYLNEVKAVGAPRESRTLRLMAFGVGAGGVLLHDPTLVDLTAVPDDVDVVGYPFWDGVPTNERALDAAHAWLADRSSPVVMVTGGSFGRHTDNGRAVAAALQNFGVRVLAINAGAVERHGDVLSVGWVPSSLVAPRCAAVVHQGGLGSTFGGVRAGLPAVVTPSAFDQPLTARLIEAAGIGIASSIADLGAKVRRALEDSEMANTVKTLGQRLIPIDAAARRAAEHILRAAAPSSPTMASA